ncbi:hypothetical protein EN834_13745 [bacterium M00.F.Ca.ET.191.01.1.1]|nr:hypothetical protein EN834_13745 [bacterium M00.F.Ca.ET.191.01.1.1]
MRFAAANVANAGRAASAANAANAANAASTADTSNPASSKAPALVVRARARAQSGLSKRITPQGLTLASIAALGQPKRRATQSAHCSDMPPGRGDKSATRVIGSHRRLTRQRHPATSPGNVTRQRHPATSSGAQAGAGARMRHHRM